jgi:hypothetical protein
MNFCTTLWMTDGRQRRERDDRVETVAELRREHAVQRFLVLARPLGRTEAEGRLGHFRCAPHWSS